MHNDAVHDPDHADPQAFSVIHPRASAPLLLVCDHASPRIPYGLRDLGLPRAEIERHIGWDIGAAEVTRRLADELRATAVLSGFSRLVIDCNRSTDDPTSIPAVSDETIVPGNAMLTAVEREHRAQAWLHPYHRAIDKHLTRLERIHPVAAVISIHSFTPVLNDGAPRPWSVGILWNRDPRLAPLVMTALRAKGLQVGDNEPYSGHGPAYTIDTHAAVHGRPHITFEIRQDLISDGPGTRKWGRVLAEVLRPVLERTELQMRRHY
ncbi:MAG TPA: N-formylglutamate amidohydrolase [Magnetospirillaceae bacterium]|jgi:predicted N-formylglutamate amidohydrolase